MDETKIADIIKQAASEEVQNHIDEELKKHRSAPGSQVLDLKECDILKVLKGSYIAERFFGKSRSWLCHKLNHDIKNGKPDDFTTEERAKLKDALDTIAYEIQILSDNL